MQAYKIINIKKIGTLPTVDIEVKNKSHIFYGNSIATSNSHGISYAVTSYLSAYIKQHFPLPYFKHNLRHSKFKNKDKQLEMRHIILDAKKHGIDILPHDLRDNNYEFEIFDKKIKFGLINIKNVGELTYNYIRDNIDDIRKCNWLRFLIYHASNLNSRHIISIIQSGCMDYMGLNRKKMVFDYNIISELSDKQISKIKELDLNQFKTIKELFIYLSQLDTGKDKILSSVTQKEKILNLLNLINNPPESLEYSMLQIEKLETDLLNFALSCTRLDGNINAGYATMKCMEFYNSNVSKNIAIAGILEEVKMIKTKSGTDMCFLSLVDDTGELSDIVGFSEFLTKEKEKLVKDNTVIIKGYRSPKNKQSLVATEIEEI